MVVSLPRKKSKKTDKRRNVEQRFSLTYLSKLLCKIPTVFFVLLVIYIWSFSTSIVPGSIIHICVTSRKINNLYCLTAGSQPVVNNDTSKLSVSPPRSPSESILNLNAIQKETHSVIELPSIRNVSENTLSTRSSKFKTSVFKAKEEKYPNARKDVEVQVAILRSYTSKTKPLDCDGRGIYVYELPEKFNKGLLAKCNEIMTWMDYCKYFVNNAVGEPLSELGRGWYNTHQYSLEPIFHSRVLNHPCRVQNVTDAKIFYVPFYGGLDVLRWHFKNVSKDVKDKLSEELVEWLKSQYSWRRNLGFDHVFVLGKISWDFRRTKNGTWGTRLLELEELQNPMKLLIERHPWKVNEVGIPHPTYFHPNSDQDILALQAKISDIHRVHLIGFAGASRNNRTNIRSILIEQCTSNPDSCTFFDCRKENCLSPVPVITLFMESEFCLQPPGDSPTRKSFFDSLVAGCIPVVFNPFTAYYQYPWHLPSDHTKYSVFIDQEDVRSSEVNVVDMLVKIPFEERKKMRKYIIDELMPRLVYSDSNAKLENFEDAFSVGLNNLLERAADNLPGKV